MCTEAARAVQLYVGCAGVDTSLNTALREVMSTKCCQCNLVGAAVQCSAVNCKRAFHMHCAAAAKVDWGKPLPWSCVRALSRVRSGL